MFALKLFAAVFATMLLGGASCSTHRSGGMTSLFTQPAADDRCAMLASWTQPMERSAIRRVLDPGPLDAAPQFRDTAFAPVFGKSYWDINSADRRSIVQQLQSCFKDWRGRSLTRAFNEGAADWQRAIERVQPRTIVSRQQQTGAVPRTALSSGGQPVPSATPASRGDANADSVGRYNELRARMSSELRKSPCNYEPSHSYDLNAMPPVVAELVRLRTQSGIGGEENLPFWAEVLRANCDEVRNGPLPSFEAAVNMISRGYLDPCTFDPKINYSAIQENVVAGTRRYSRTEYDSMLNLDYFVRGQATPAQRQCFFDMVRARIRGAI